ncbi:DUF4209 domain-containing protein [Butyricicoccus faecihominis]|uniref:DUF4209 domain-containing protein n=1 Tax=Butyricicoccus faecihominis TaxID=1712515 RepID=UPI0024788FC4|nr:DUF4209 domain-containing protein [Butyricicoccus faecihominis]MCQ5130985.1 DUF4209 domain-containing protein [Butyricicoccus faecihominis]
MTVYEALQQITNKSFVLFGTDAFQPDISALDNEADKYTYNLIKDVCSLHAEITDKNIEFQPSIVLRGRRSFALQDMEENDFKLLESLNLDLIPVNICARIADMLWTQRKSYAHALVAIDAYTNLFELLFSENDWIESLDMIRRALCISAQVNQQEKHVQACKSVYDKILRINGTDELFLSLNLIEIIVKEKYGDIGRLIEILNKVIQNSEPDVHKTETAYELTIECFKWKKDNSGVYDTYISLAQYYEKKAGELSDDDFRSVVIAEGFLKKAALLYRNNKEPEHAEKIQKQIVCLQSKIPLSMGVIQRSYDVSNLHVYMVECFDGLSFQEALLRLTQFTSFRKKADIKSTVITELKEHPLSHLFSKKFTNAAGQTVLALDPLDMKNPESDQKLLEAHMHRQMLQYEEIEGDLYLGRALGIIRNNYDFVIDDIDFLVLSNPIIPQERERIFKSAIYMALKGQVYEAIHILSSQAENLFRNLAKELGALTVTLENDGTSKEKVLTSVFDLPELIDAYDNDILFLFEGLLNTPAGANIRNDVAHGLLTEAAAKSGACIYFICAVIRLLSYTSLKCGELFATSTKIKDLKPPTKDR